MALLHHSNLDAEAIAREALKIASQICIYTNDDITVETA
jgi:ATP-dependent HslUV protease subunit HslV